MRKTIYWKWFPYYLTATLYSTVLTSPLVLGGLNMPIERPGFIRIVLTGIVSSLFIMILSDALITWFYLFRKKWDVSSIDVFKVFPTFTIYRSLSVHWLGFSIPLSLFWTYAYRTVGLRINSVELIYYLIVLLLMSYIHSILEYYLVIAKFEPLTTDDIQREFKRQANRMSLATKISRITIFVGVIPLTLLTFTFYLKLVQAEQLHLSIDSLIKQLTIWGGTYGLVAIIMSVILVRILSRDIAQGAWRLSEGFHKLASGEKINRLELDTADEFESLAISFNSLVSELEKKETIYREFGRLVDPKIRDEVLAGKVNPSGEQHYGVVLFCDIVDFTILTENLDAEELIKFLNAVLDRIVETILKNGGTVNKFMGDAILAFWNLPIETNDPELSALRCALQMHDEIDKYNDESKTMRETHEPPIPPVRIGVGLSSGKMIAGTVGAEQRREYTVLGSNVNLSSRLQQQTRVSESEILVSNSIFVVIRQYPEAIRDEFEFIPHGKITLKGILQPQTIYGVKRNRSHPTAP